MAILLTSGSGDSVPVAAARDLPPTQGLAPNPQDTNLKPWSDKEGQRLTWDDFQGTPPDPLPTDEEGNVVVAKITYKHRTDLSWSNPSETQNPDGTWSCTATLTISSSTSMDKSKSWVNPASKTKALLDHEQKHLDLAEEFRRDKLQPQLDDLEGTYTGTGASAEAACADAQAKARAAIAQVMHDKGKKHDQAQKDLDKDTNNGQNTDKQKEWRNRLNESLKLTDKDGDSIPDVDDNCWADPNAGQQDTDGDGMGDDCQQDTDADGIPDTSEERLGSNPLEPDSTPEDLSHGTTCVDSIDNDLDGLVDQQDDGCQDLDGDLASDATDKCPNIPDSDQADNEQDGLGDLCDQDDDNDEIPDDIDKCPNLADPDQPDLDGDGIGDTCDFDLDGDGWNQLCVGNPYRFCSHAFDNCPFVANTDQKDSDGDFVGDACEAIGGTAEIAVGESDAPASGAGGSGSSSPPHVALAGGIATAALAVAAGAWYARRRWLR